MKSEEGSRNGSYFGTRVAINKVTCVRSLNELESEIHKLEHARRGPAPNAQ